MLDVYPVTVELEVGDSYNVLVYTESANNDENIFWYTPDAAMIDGKWNDWINENVCYLTVTGKKAGVTTVTVYAEKDPVGKVITVYIKNPPIPVYPSTCIDVPTYTAITGVPLIDLAQYAESTMYIYRYDVDLVYKYIDYILDNGFSLYETEKDELDITYRFINNTKRRMMCVSIIRKYNEIWIWIPRY